jgi:hypothetical protein
MKGNSASEKGKAIRRNLRLNIRIKQQQNPVSAFCPETPLTLRSTYSDRQAIAKQAAGAGRRKSAASRWPLCM